MLHSTAVCSPGINFTTKDFTNKDFTNKDFTTSKLQSLFNHLVSCGSELEILVWGGGWE